MRFREAKCLVEHLHRLLLDRCLHMQIMFRHIQIGMTDHTLDRGEVNAQRLHLTDISVAAGMRCQHADSRDCGDVFLELVPVMFGIEGLLATRGLKDVLVRTSLVLSLDFGSPISTLPATVLTA